MGEDGTRGRPLGKGLWLFAGQPDDGAARLALLRRHLAAILKTDPADLTICRDAGGKPTLAAPTKRLFFNLSHRADLVLLGVSWDHPIGVDLEIATVASDDLDRSVARTLFAKGEVRWLEEADGLRRREAFLWLWTGKEAILKTRGQGITDGLDEPDLSPFLPDLGSPPDGPLTVRAGGETYSVCWHRISTSAGPAILAYSLGGACHTSEKSTLFMRP